jgi:hypothetical protein
MKEFMMIFIGGDYQEAQLSPEQLEARMGRWYTWIEDLKSQNLYLEGKPLLPNAKRVAGPDQLVTDGPFVETKDLIGGYFLFKANDMDHAISLTSDYPDFDLGGQVEVREIMQY